MLMISHKNLKLEKEQEGEREEVGVSILVKQKCTLF